MTERNNLPNKFIYHIAAIILAITAVTTAAQAGELDDVRAALALKMPSTTIDSITKSKITGIYEITTGKNLLYVDATAEYLFLGSIYNITTHEDLTAARLQELGFVKDTSKPDGPIAWDTLPHSGAIVENAGAAHKLAVFADINCPFCRKLNDRLLGLKDIETHTFVFGLWAKSEELTKTIYCASDPAAALQQAFKDSLKVNIPADCDLAGYQAVRNFAQEHAIQGTPQMLRADGTRVTGLRSVAFIEGWVK